MTACKGDPVESDDSGDDGGSGSDTVDTGPDIPPEWGPAEINLGPYNMRLVTVTDNSCTSTYEAGASVEVELTPGGGNVLLWDYVQLESRAEQLRASGQDQQTNDATGDGTPDCTIDTQVNGNGSLTGNTEFDLNMIVEKTGTGDYCGSEYIGYTLPCSDVFTALFTSALGGGGGGGGAGGGEEGG
jgi:hypothetical protein